MHIQRKARNYSTKRTWLRFDAYYKRKPTGNTNYHRLIASRWFLYVCVAGPLKMVLICEMKMQKCFNQVIFKILITT